jgi:hypothetical protein
MPSILTTLRPHWPPALPWISISDLSSCWDLTNLPATRRPLYITLAIITLPTALYLLPTAISSYRTFLAVGPGGLPHNVWGFLVQCAMRVVARGDVRAVPPPYYRRAGSSSSRGKRSGREGVDELVVDPAVLAAYAPHGRRSFLPAADETSSQNDGNDEVAGGTLPLRKPPRPSVPDLVAPQRQVSMQGSPETIARMERFLHRLVEANTSVLEMRPSGLEGKAHQAVFLKDRLEVPECMGMARGEIVHVHPEGSSHMTVSLVDGEEAVVKGW